ncbi:MAG: hypothetical protein ABJB98_09995 [Actinomycetota bacterium]
MTAAGLELDLPTGWLRLNPDDQAVADVLATELGYHLPAPLRPALASAVRAGAEGLLVRLPPADEDPPFAVVGALVVHDSAAIDVTELRDALDREGIGAAVGMLDGVPVLASAARDPGGPGSPSLLIISYLLPVPTATVVLAFVAVETAPARCITAEVARVICAARIVHDCGERSRGYAAGGEPGATAG